MSEQHHQAIIRGLHEGIIVYDANGKICLCNPSAEKLLGLPASQLLEQTDWNLVMVREDGSDFPKDSHPATITLRTKRACINQVMGIYKQNDTFSWLNINSQPLQSHSNNLFLGVVITLIDISEQKQIEDSLREKAALLSALFNTINMGIAITDETGRFVRVNPAYCQLYGYRAEELLGQSFTILFPPPIRQIALQAHTDFLAGKTDSYNQWPLQHHDGHVLNYPVTESKLIGNDGTLFKVIVVTADSNRTTEEEVPQAIDLTSNETWLRQLLRLLPVTVLSLDRKGHLTFAEGQHLGKLNLASKKAIGQSIFEISQQLAPLEQDVRRALGGETFNKVIVCAGVSFKIKYMPLLKANKWVGIQVVLHDITEPRVLKSRLEKTRQEADVLAAHTSLGLMHLDQQKIVRVNQQCAVLLGYTPTELLKISVDRLYRTPADYVRFQQQAGLCLANMATYDTQQWLRKKNGTYVHCKLTVKTLASNRVLWLLEKITEQKQIQVSLNNLQAILWITLNEAILITDIQLRILKVNPASSTLTGYTTEELLGKSLQYLQTGHQKAPFYQQIMETMSQQGQWQGCIWLRHKNNAVYTCELKLQAYNDEDGIGSHYVAILGNPKTRQSAFDDPLTNLPSRQLFRHNLLKTLAQAQRNNKLFAVLLIGIDDMVAINMKYGGKVGDQFLCAIGHNLKSSVRDSDTVARYDGDQFSVNLDEIARLQDAGLVAQMLLFKLTQPIVLKEKSVPGSVSIGIAVYPDDGTEVDTLLELAEGALQHAKQQGGNQCYFHNPTLQEQYE